MLQLSGAELWWLNPILMRMQVRLVKEENNQCYIQTFDQPFVLGTNMERF